MIKLSPLRLNNHPDAKRAELIHNKVYIELAVEVRNAKTSIITDTNNLTHKGQYEVKIMLSGIILAISEYCDAYKMGIRVGDTVLLAKELETNVYADGNKVPNMFCDIMSYKTLEEFEEYTKSPFNGPTVVIDDFKITGKVVSDIVEAYPILENNDTKTIN